MINWITGATSGIGKSLTLALASKGQKVIASARNHAELTRLEGMSDNITALDCDISDHQSMADLSRRLGTMTNRLDRIFLNAGNCEYLDFPEPDWSAARRLMDVNFFGSLNCTEIALPLLRNSDLARPHIVVMASQVTAAPFPRAEAYGATKAALQYFYHSLRLDLLKDNIDITVVNPGFVDTPLTRKNDFDMPFLMTADDAANRILKKIDSRPRQYSFPKRLSLLLAISKIMPGVWQKLVGVDISEKSERGLQK